MYLLALNFEQHENFEVQILKTYGVRVIFEFPLFIKFRKFWGDCCAVPLLPTPSFIPPYYSETADFLA